jgi:hypothetical protein
MRQWARAALLGVLCLVLGAAPAPAQHDDWGDDAGGDALDRAREGFFLGATANYAIDNFSLPDSGGFFGPPGRQFDRSGIDDSWGFSFRGGWRFNPFLAAEAHLEYEDQFGFMGNDVEVSRSSTLATLRTVAFGVNARGYVLGKGVFNGAVQPYAVAGFGLLHTRQKPTDDGIALAEAQGQPLTPAEVSGENATGPALRAGIGFDLYGYGSDQAGVNIETSYVIGLSDVWPTQYWVTNFGLFYRW